MRICSPVSRCQGNGALARKFSALRHFGCECAGLAGPWLVGMVFLDRPEINIALRLGVAVGFLGAFTTFSAFSFESIQLLLNGAVWRAVLNVTVNTVVCLGMCYLGMQLARLS